MKQNRIIFAIIFGLALFVHILSGLALAQEQMTSGGIRQSIRFVQLHPGSDNQIRVFRGDYIRPLLKGTDSFVISMPDLDIKKSFPAPEPEANYIKLKNTGRFPFTAGDASGTFEVIDYSSPSYTELDTASAYHLLQNTRPLILDVRTRMEFARGHIKDAVLIPVQELESRLTELDEFKHQDVFVYCASGNRSTVAARIMINSGFKRIYNLRYGIYDWLNHRYEISK